MKTFPCKMFLGAAALLVGFAPIANAETAHAQIQNLRGLQLQHAKVPVLNQDKLQMVIFANSAERRGEMLVGFDTVLTIIRRGADADKIRDDWKLTPYPLGAQLPEILDFWKERIVYSEGIMDTAEAEIDNTGRRAGGNREVHFRSPLLDLDGVGFEADFRRRTISVNSQVRIVIRQSSADPAELLKDPKKMPEKYEFITASSDSMLIDSRRDEAMLVGNVRVVEAQGILTCDRLTIFWKTGGDRKKYESAEEVENELRKSGIERVLADGNVVITKRDNPREQIFADHLICDVPKGTVNLSGDTRPPRFVSANGDVLSGRDISFERDTKRGRVTGGCRLEAAPEKNDKGEMVVLKKLVADTGFFDSNQNFADFSGKVTMHDGDRSISCDRMRIVTGDRKAAPGEKPSRKLESGTASLLGSPDLGAGGKELKSAEFHGHVVMRDASKSKLSCDEMHADFAPGGGGGGTELVGAQWFRNVRVESSGADGTPSGVITADCGELDNRNNRVTFERNVTGKRDKTTLKCRRLDVYLTAGKGADAPGGIAIGAGGGRVVRKIIASGRTKITDASGSLDCDKLTLFFSELPAGAKPTPGMFQGGGAQLTDILADGHVVAVNLASQESVKQPGMLSGKSSGNRKMYADHGRVDLTRHLSRFNGSVMVKDDENQLSCDEMFIYGIRRLADVAAPKGKTPPNDPDADPFELTGFTEDNVPAAINLNDDVQLKKILCLGNVHLVRTESDSGRKQEAGGGRCVYLTDKRVITLTDKPPRRPWLRAEGRQQYGSRIVYDLNDNIFRSYDTDTFTIESGK